MAETQGENVAIFIRQMTSVNLVFKVFMQRKFKEYDVDITFEMLQVLRFLWKKDGKSINQSLAERNVPDSC